MKTADWKIVGPGGGGAMYYPTISPHNPRTVMIGCDMSDSFITVNGGESWTELNFHANARAFAYDPVNPGVIYAGSNGLYRTDNGGRDWRLLFPAPSAVKGRTFLGDHADEIIVSSDNWPGGHVVAIAVSQTDPKVLFIGINGNGVGIYRSEDCGASWKNIGSMNGSDFMRIYVEGTGDIIAMASEEICRFSGTSWKKEQLPLPGGRAIQDCSAAQAKGTGATVLYAATGSSWQGSEFHSGLYKSTDGAATWAELSGGLDTDVAAGEARTVNRVAACAADAAVVYASIREPVGDNTHYFGILKSDDGGKSWRWAMRMDDTQPANRATGWVEKDYDTSWGGAPFWMGVSPNEPDICYATDWGTVYNTLDGGKTWRQLYSNQQPDGSWASRGVDVTNVYELGFDPFDKNHLLLPCTDIGLFASHDGGTGWLHAQNGVPKPWSNTCYSVLFDPEVKGRVWSTWANCHDLPRQKMMGHKDKCVGGVCKSDDGAQNWLPSNSGMPAGCLVTHVILDPKSKPGSRTLYAAGFGQGVFKSTDDGSSWAAMNNGITGNMNAWRLCLTPGGRLYLLVAGNIAGGKAVDGALYCSDDGAASWQKLPLPKGVYFPNDIGFDPRNPDKVYLACWGSENGQPERCGGLYVSQDGGKGWTPLLDKSLHVYGITVWGNNPDILYATTYEGNIYRSVDCGKSWVDFQGCNFKWPKKVQADPADGGMVYITTFGACAWHGPAEGGPREFGNVRQQ